jgi:hypothetical protein
MGVERRQKKKKNNQMPVTGKGRLDACPFSCSAVFLLCIAFFLRLSRVEVTFKG